MTAIEWTEKTWNPIVGCSIVSPGCTNCYAMKMAARIEHMNPKLEHYRGLTQQSKAGPVWTGKLALAPEHILLEPLRRKKPTMWFVNSMSDLFHEDVPDEWIDRVFAVMALTPQHTYQVLTKRSERMRAYFARTTTPDYEAEFDDDSTAPTEWAILRQMCGDMSIGRTFQPPVIPLPNVWLGVSAERQQEADARIPDLLATPAAVRFVSAEPLLGPVDFTAISWIGGRRLDALQSYTSVPTAALGTWAHEPNDMPSLDWIIVGGESGQSARPMHPFWARSIRDQCQAAGVAFFFKQHGAWGPVCDVPEAIVDAAYDPAPPNDPEAVRRCRVETMCLRSDGSHVPLNSPNAFSNPDPMMMLKLGKGRSGRLLGGRTWDEMPSTSKQPTEASHA